MLRADDARQRCRQSEAGMKTEPGKIGGKPRFRAGDAEIRDHREPEAAADRRPLDRGDDRLLGAEKTQRLLIEVLRRARCFRRGAGGRPVSKIGAGAEHFSFGSKHQCAAGGIFVERLEGIGERVDQRIVEEILRRPVEHDRRHMPIERNAYVFAHSVLIFR